MTGSLIESALLYQELFRSGGEGLPKPEAIVPFMHNEHAEWPGEEREDEEARKPCLRETDAHVDFLHHFARCLMLNTKFDAECGKKK